MENVLALIRARDLEQAETELNQRQQQGEAGAGWFVARGLLLEAKGEIEASIEAFESACKRDGENPEAVFHLARVLDLYTDDDRPLELYEQLSDHTPAYLHALLNLTVALEDRGHYEEALDCVLRVLEEHPNHTRARMFLKDIQSSMSMHYDEDQEATREKRDALLETPISDFELSVRSRNCLKKMNINVLGDLLRVTEAELLSYKNFGETSLSEIKAMLKQRNVRIGQMKEEAQQGSRSSSYKSHVSGANPEVLNKYLSDIEFSGRSRKCLQRLGLVTVGDLTMKTEAELLASKNFGQTSLLEVKQKLAEFGLTLRK